MEAEGGLQTENTEGKFLYISAYIGRQSILLYPIIKK